jgi:hypothetical protein
MTNKKSKSFGVSLIITLVTSLAICVLMVVIAIPLQDQMVKIPFIWATCIAIFTNIAILIWAWFRPKSFIFQDAPSTGLWRDLRIWITIFIAMQITGYWTLR